MGQRITIEKWAENLEEVTIGRWVRVEGDTLRIGDILCEIITDKVTFEYTIEQPGTLSAIYAAEHSVVPVGYVIAFISEGGEPPDEDIPELNERLLAEHQERSEPDLELDLDAILGSAGGGRKTRAVPAARRMARQAGIELDDVAEWLGAPDRAITVEDVEGYIEQVGGADD